MPGSMRCLLPAAISVLVFASAAPCGDVDDIQSRKLRQEASDEWCQARQEVIRELADRDVIDWSNQLAAGLDRADRRTLFTALDVFIRAGHHDRVPEAVRRLCKLKLPTIIHHYIAEGELIERGLWDSLRILLDARPDFCPAYFEKYRHHWWETGDRAELERWLKTRYDADWRAWHRHYFWVLAERGELAALADELRAGVSDSPTDGQLAFKYLAAVRALEDRIPSAEDRPSVAWLGEVARPEFSMDSYDLGKALAERGHFLEAIKLFDHSLSRPIVDYDKKAMQQRCSRLFREGEHEPAIRRWTKGALAKNCKEAGQLKRAQALVEELVGPGATLGDLQMVRFAGQVQHASGQRVIENRIKKAEVESKDSVQYWLGRAQYYTGREEDGQAEEAFQKALALPPDGGRSNAVQQYAQFLAGSKDRFPEAVKLLRDELERIGPNDLAAPYIIHRLLDFDRRGQATFTADDSLLWHFLDQRNNYDHTAETVLATLLKKAHAAGGQAAFWEKTLKLAGPDSDPRRRFVVGSLLLHSDDAGRALPLLEDAYRRWPHGSLRSQFASTLLFAYLQTGDWKSAEKVFRQERHAMVVSDVYHGLVDLAVAAARGGDRDASLRLWRERVNLDMNDLDHQIHRMVGADMKTPLNAFYAGLAKRDPGNRAVAAALEALKPQ